MSFDTRLENRKAHLAILENARQAHFIRLQCTYAPLHVLCQQTQYAAVKLVEPTLPRVLIRQVAAKLNSALDGITSILKDQTHLLTSDTLGDYLPADVNLFLSQVRTGSNCSTSCIT